MQSGFTEKEADYEEISRAEAARLLGVTSPTLRRFPIPYRQYMKRGNCYYRKSDVLQFKHDSMNEPT